MSERVVAAFDLDGTLTRGDTLLPFLSVVCGRRRTGAALLGEGASIATALVGRGSRDEAKARLLARLVAGYAVADLEEVAERFAESVVSSRLRRPVAERVAWHRQMGHAVVVVSASPELYVSAIGRRLGADAVLGTRLEVDAQGRLTGRLDGPNCRGAEKVRRLQGWLGGPCHLYAYGDSRGDDELLAAAAVGVRVTRRGFLAVAVTEAAKSNDVHPPTTKESAT